MIRFIASCVRFGCKVTFVFAGVLIPVKSYFMPELVALMCASVFIFLLVGNPNKMSD